MKQFLKELKSYAWKFVDKKESEELVTYYQEIITDRLLEGESIEEILKDYDIAEVIKEAIPQIMRKTPGNVFKTMFKILIVLFSTPILIPVAVVFLVLIIVAISLFITFIAVGIAIVFSLLFYTIEIFQYTGSFSKVLGLISLGVIATTIVFYFSYLLSYGLYYGLQKLTKAILGVIFKKRGQHENI